MGISLFMVTSEYASPPNAAVPRLNWSRRVGRSHAPCNLGSVLALDHSNVVLNLQIKLELCTISKITAESHGGISGDRPTPV